MHRDNMVQVILTGEETAIRDLKQKITLLNVHISLIPTIQFEKCMLDRSDQNKLMQLSSYDYLFFTSVRSVHFFIDALTEYQVDLDSVDIPPVVAVGPMTARACVRAGLSVVSAPTHFTVDHMIKKLPTLRGKKILFPRSAIAPRDTIVSINNSGAGVSQLTLYTTIYRTDALKEVNEIALTNADYVIFLSPSSIKSFMSCVSNSTLTRILQTTMVLCIGPRTARTASLFNFKNVTVATEFTTQGVINTLKTLV